MTQQFGRITANLDVIYPRYDTQKFVGRQWLIDIISQFRDDLDKRHLIIIGEPGSGKSTFIAYLAETWNCPRHFIRVDNISGVTGVDPRAFLLSIGTQLYQKYGSEIFRSDEKLTTKVTVGLSKDQAEVVGRVIEELHTPLPFLEQERATDVKVGAALGESKVIGERVKRLVNNALSLPETTLLHIAVLQPLEKLSELYPDERVVVLVDALDESLQHPGRSILDVIPTAADSDFPGNLRLLITSRPGKHLVRFKKKDLLSLDDKEAGHWEETRKDARTYIDRRLSGEPMADVLAAMPQEKLEAFIEEIETKSDGNFLYLYHFMNAVSEGFKAGVTDLGEITIPADLDEIYRFFAMERIRKNPLDLIHFLVDGSIHADMQIQLQAIEGVENIIVAGKEATMITQDIDPVLPRLFDLVNDAHLKISDLQTERGTQMGTWEEKYLPIMGVLAVAFEALSRDQIAGFAGVEVKYVDSIIAQLLQFLDTINVDSSIRYRLYHPSFNEYLLDNRRNRNFPLEASDYSARIAAYYRNGFKTLAEVNWSSVGEKYPFNHLAAHLVDARLYKELFTLINQAWWQARYQTDNYTFSGLLADVERAWEAALGKGKEEVTLSTLIRLKTERLLIGQQVSTFSDVDLQALIWLGRQPEALAHARMRNSALERISGLIVIYHALNQMGQPNFALLEEAERMAMTIQSDSDRSRIMNMLIETLIAAGRLDQAYILTRTILDVRQHGPNWSLTMAFVAANRLDDAIQTVRSIQDPWNRSLGLLELSDNSYVKSEPKMALSLLHEAEAAAHTVEVVADRAALLTRASIELSRLGLYDEAFSVANSITVSRRRAQALGGIATTLWNTDNTSATKTFEAAVKLANEIHDPEDRASALGVLIGNLIDVLRFDEAWKLFCTVQDQKTKDSLGSALQELVIALCRQRKFEKAKEVSRSIENKWNRDNAQFNIAISMIQDERCDDAREAAITIESEGKRAIVESLIELATLLGQLKNNRASAIFEKVVGAAQQMESVIFGQEEKKREVAEALGELAALLDQSQNPRARPIFDKVIAASKLVLEDLSLTGEKAVQDLVVILAQVGLTEQAYLLVQKLEGDSTRAEGLKRLAIEFARLGIPKAKEVYDEARELSDAFIDSENWAEVLSEFTHALCKFGYYDSAYTLILLIRVEHIQRDLLIQLAESLTKVGQYAKARPILDNIKESWKRAEGLGRIAACLAAREDRRTHQAIRDAIDAALAVTTEINWVAARILVSEAFAQIGHVDEILELANAEKPLEHSGEPLRLSLSAIKLAGGVQEHYARALVVALLKAARKSEAFQFAQEVETPEIKAVALCTLVVNLAEAGDDDANQIIGEATELIQTLTDEERDTTLSKLAFDLIKVGAYPLANTVVQAIEAIQERALVLSSLAVALAKSKDSALDRIIKEVLQLEALSAEVLGNVTTALVLAGRLDEAMGISQSIADSSIKETVMVRMATACVQAGLYSDALMLIGTPRINLFMRTLGEWATTFDGPGAGLSITFLWEATDVTSWANPKWRKIHEVLTKIQNKVNNKN